MDDVWKAKQRIDQQAIELAQEICSLSLNYDMASELFTRAVQTMHIRVNLGVNSPRFQSRAEEHRLKIVEQQIKEANETLVTQLGELGIDPAPIFGIRPAGGD